MLVFPSLPPALLFSRSIDRSALLGVLTGWAFDHNTVESVLIFAAAMVRVCCVWWCLPRGKRQVAVAMVIYL